jgi:2-oxoglutarate dehydrogenase complex dehydrogenase (E1) component-like enzyme
MAFAHANIVEELTSLNNLYKEGAITQEEFTKAKSILLQNKDKEENKKKIEKVKKKKIEKKEKNKIVKKIEKKKNEDLTKTYISLAEFNELGTYKKIVKYPDGLFKVKGSPESMAKEAMMKMYQTFVQKPKLMEKYPENMMKAMAYFEIFYNLPIKR